SEVARLAQGFEMRVLAVGPSVSSFVARDENVRLVSLEELLKSSDIVSLHASATSETFHLLNARTLALAKPGLRVINCARGELVDEAPLLAGLESAQVAGAGLDVFETEPRQATRLVSYPTVTATPHIARCTEEGQGIVG